MATQLNPTLSDLGEFSVNRYLPNMQKKMVGAFVFFDHMGPADFAKGSGIDVRPHPHIGLATITYLMEGSILHRDSLGNNLEIYPGDVNWMTAGKGIVHSERETIEVRANQHVLNGIQTWLALPQEKAEIDPSFTHVKKCTLPNKMFEGVLMRLIAGEAFGKTSPVKTYSPMFYLDIVAAENKTIEQPNPNHETGVYILDGSVVIGDSHYKKGDMLLLGDAETIISRESSRFLLFGGEKFETTPHMYWNFVSFEKDRIEQAKDDWNAGRFPKIPGDDEEHIPLPAK